jgi:mRNA interferase MazF
MPLRLNRGEIWLADLRPTHGPEHAAACPVVIISTNIFNHGPAELVFVLPVTRMDRRIPMHVQIDPPEGGVSARSYIVCDALCTLAKERLGPRPWGRVSAATLHKVVDNLCILMALSVSPESLLYRTPVAAWRRDMGAFEALEHEVNGTDPHQG